MPGSLLLLEEHVYNDACAWNSSDGKWNQYYSRFQRNFKCSPFYSLIKLFCPCDMLLHFPVLLNSPNEICSRIFFPVLFIEAMRYTPAFSSCSQFAHGICSRIFRSNIVVLLWRTCGWCISYKSHLNSILKNDCFFVICTYSELSGSMSHVHSFLHYMLFVCEKCLYLDCKLVLEIIRKLQTRMPQLTIHQYTKTKAATIFVMQ